MFIVLRGGNRAMGSSQNAFVCRDLGSLVVTSLIDEHSPDKSGG